MIAALVADRRLLFALFCQLTGAVDFRRALDRRSAAPETSCAAGRLRHNAAAAGDPP